MAIKSTDTYAEWLQKVLQLIQQGKVMTDALPHLAEITDLETTVLAMLHQPVDNAQGNSQVPVPDMGMSGPPGMDMGQPVATPNIPPITTGAPLGITPQAPPIPVDELRRILGNGG